MLYTKKGDGGQTGNFDDDRIGKDDLLVEVLGSLDEVVAFLAICKNKVNGFVSKGLDISFFDILGKKCRTASLILLFTRFLAVALDKVFLLITIPILGFSISFSKILNNKKSCFMVLPDL